MKVPGITASRGPPKKVSPIVYENVKISTPLGRMGYIEARDLNKDTLIWDLKVYEIEYIPELERDVQDRFIISLKLENNLLEVINEGKEKFLVNLDTKEIKKA